MHLIQLLLFANIVSQFHETFRALGPVYFVSVDGIQKEEEEDEKEKTCLFSILHHVYA